MAQLEARADARDHLDPEQEYRAIERALVETARGRWFLAEHGRRARRLDSTALFEAIGRLQTTMREPPALLGQLQTEIHSLQNLLGQSRAELLAKPAAVKRDVEAGEGKAASGTEGGPNGILAFAEDIHEIAWTLQARDVDVEACERLAKSASQIYALSLRQAIESKRIQQLSEALDAALARLDGLLETIGHEMQADEFSPLPADVATA